MVVLILATGFAPLDLEDDHDRFDFRYDYDSESDEYVLSTLHDRGGRVGLASPDRAMRSSGTPSCIT